ncbi:MAG: VCBS repeat-containing protein [Blastocatellales bacterium]|nr:VCBS repeat-containing protein [Blastocatellales bacterium]
MSQKKSSRRSSSFRRSYRGSYGKSRFIGVVLLLGAMFYNFDSGPGRSAAAPAPQSCADLGFTEGARLIFDENLRSIAVGDFNNDGNQDVVASALDGGLRVRLGDGMGGFTVAEDADLGYDTVALVVADFNKDGNLDVAGVREVTEDAGAVGVLLGDGIGGFGELIEYEVGIEPQDLAVADFNLDNNLDIATANDDSSDISLLFGNGLGGFGTAVSIPVGLDPGSLAVGDFNLDNRPDIAVLTETNMGVDMVEVLLGNGAGGFAAPAPFDIGPRARGLVVADFNNDGNPDLAAANIDDGTVSVMLGDGMGGFGARNFYSVGSNPSDTLVGDFNNDGYADLALLTFSFDTYSSSIVVLLGDGTGAFSAAVTLDYDDELEDIAAADFNNDGKLDLIASLDGVGNDFLFLLLNTCIPDPNTPPSIVAETVVRTQGSPATIVKIAAISDPDQSPETLLFSITPIAGSGVSIGTPWIDSMGNVTASAGASCAATSSTFELEATDEKGESTTAVLTVNVHPNPLPVLSYTNKSLGVGKTALFYPSTGPSDNVGITSLVLQTIAPATGLELSLNTSNGVITVLSASIAGTYIVEIAATDNCGAQRIATFNVTVTCPSISLSTLANGQAGVAYNRTITVTPAGSYTFTVISGALPPGLVLDETTGAITGTPGATGTFNFTVRAAGTSGCSATRAYSLVISCPMVTVGPASLPAARQGVFYSQTVTVAPAGSYGFVLSFGSLPPGLALNAMTGEISGTPVLKGSYYVTVRAGGFGACTGSRSYMLVVQ